MSAAALSALSSLSEQSGPFVTIYLDTESAVENAAARLETRWKDVVRDLEGAGVDPATIAVLTEARGGHELGGTRVLIGSHGTVHLARSLTRDTDTDVIRVGPLPYLLPYVAWAQTRMPHLVVLVDRQGADILAYAEGGDPAESVTVDSDRYPVHRSRRGDWSAKHFEFKVEENWKASAQEAAERVRRVAQDVDAQLIVLAGDDRAVDLLREHLPKPLAGLVKIVSGGRSLDGSDAHIAEQVIDALASRLRDQVADALEQFAKYRNRARAVAETHPGTDGTDYALNAANGVVEVVAALQKAQVSTLLLAEDVDETAPLHFGPAPTMLATRRSQLLEMGVNDTEEAPGVDVLLRAAIATDALVLVVPAGTPDSPEDGVGALLRYSDNADGPEFS